MSYQSFLSELPAQLQEEVLGMDVFLKSLLPLKFKRAVDKKKINYVSPSYGISYAIFPLGSEPAQHFGWYYLYEKEAKNWYRKPDYFVETLRQIAATDPQAAQRIFGAINECTACKGSPCSAISYTYEGEQKAACYGRIIMGLGQEDFEHAKAFFRHLNALLSQNM